MPAWFDEYSSSEAIRSKPSIGFGLLTVKQACSGKCFRTRCQDTRSSSEIPAIYLRSEMVEVNGTDLPAPLMSWSAGSTELHGVTCDLYEQKMRDESLL